MIIDNIFHEERRTFRKLALLSTIPCAILPIAMAGAGLMSVPFEPMLFPYDWILWTTIYIVYAWGLYFSWLHHKRLLPAIIFLLHLLSIGMYILSGQPEQAGFMSILSIVITSVANQYFRVGSLECEACSPVDGACVQAEDANTTGSRS